MLELLADVFMDFGHGGQTVKAGKQRLHGGFKVGDALVIGEID